MTPDIKKYPLDLTGEAITNRVNAEKKVIANSNDVLITLNAGVFYAKGLLIETSTKTLEKDKDFILNYIHEDITIRSGCGAYALIVIINPDIKGDLSISYQAVGGEYTKLDDAIIQAIEDINNTETVVRWDSVINKPLTYPSSAHVHVADDIVGTEDIVSSINSIAGAIKGEHPAEIEKIHTLLEDKVSNRNYKRINQVDKQWILTITNPLRISAKPYPSAIVINLDIYQSDIGYSKISVSGELTPSGDWLNRYYSVTYGKVPAIEMQLIATDGASAELLIKATKSTNIYISPNEVIYLKHRPEVTSVSTLDMDSINTPIPNEFQVPIKD